MLTTLLYLCLNMFLVACITFVAVMWFGLNSLKLFEGPVLYQLSATHGVHLLDVAALLIEVALFGLLFVSLARQAFPHRV